MYELVFDQKALYFLEKSELSLAKRIWKKLQAAKENPHHFFEKLEGRTDYKLRIGDYRILADIDDSAKKIEITLISHRKNIYKNI